MGRVRTKTVKKSAKVRNKLTRPSERTRVFSEDAIAIAGTAG